MTTRANQPGESLAPKKGHMPKVRGNGAARWAQRTAAATEDYKAGVANPRQSWQTATTAATEVHKQATMAALQAGSFAKGVAKAGDAKWSNAAQGKGAERFGPGAAAGVQDYQTGVQPYLDVIANTTLPPRGPKGDPRNINRVAVLAAALRKKKTGFGLVPLLILAMVLSVLSLALVSAWGHWGTARASGGDNAGMPLNKAEKLTGPKQASLLALAGALVAAGCMGAALDTVTAFATAPGAGGAAAAASPGDTLAIRNETDGSAPILLTAWMKSQVSGFVQLTHPSGSDQVRDIRLRHVAAAPLPLFCPGIGEPVQPQELLALTMSGSAVAGQTEILTMMMYYPDLPGVNTRLLDIAGLEGRFQKLVTVEDSTTATVAANYGGARALNAASDLLLANTDYAVLGAHIGVLCSSLTLRGVDTGNLRVAIPGMLGRPDVTAQWFVYMSEQFGLPLIPVINTGNKGGILIENVQDQALAAVPFSLLLAQLSPG